MESFRRSGLAQANRALEGQHSDMGLQEDTICSLSLFSASETFIRVHWATTWPPSRLDYSARLRREEQFYTGQHKLQPFQYTQVTLGSLERLFKHWRPTEMWHGFIFWWLLSMWGFLLARGSSLEIDWFGLVLLLLFFFVHLCNKRVAQYTQSYLIYIYTG